MGESMLGSFMAFLLYASIFGLVFTTIFVLVVIDTINIKRKQKQANNPNPRRKTIIIRRRKK